MSLGDIGCSEVIDEMMVVCGWLVRFSVGRSVVRNFVMLKKLIVMVLVIGVVMFV